MLRTKNYPSLVAERGQQICDKNKYTDYTRFSDGRDACIAPLMFTHAILAGLTEWGYEDRWCYHSIWDAMEAIAEWKARDGEGEPTGWHRHPDTGRRRPDGDASKEYIEF